MTINGRLCRWFGIEPPFPWLLLAIYAAIFAALIAAVAILFAVVNGGL